MLKCRAKQQQMFRRLLEDTAEPTVRGKFGVEPAAVRGEGAVSGQEKEDLPAGRFTQIALE